MHPSSPLVTLIWSPHCIIEGILSCQKSGHNFYKANYDEMNAFRRTRDWFTILLTIFGTVCSLFLSLLSAIQNSFLLAVFINSLLCQGTSACFLSRKSCTCVSWRASGRISLNKLLSEWDTSLLLLLPERKFLKKCKNKKKSEQKSKTFHA